MSVPRQRTPSGWGGLGRAGVLVLWVCACRGQEEGPPPPTPLHPPEAVQSAPTEPRRGDQSANPTPVAPAVAPTHDEPLGDPLGQFRQRQEAAVPTVAAETRPRPPPLRKQDRGIAPKSLSRQYTGRSAGKGVARVQLVATYQGKSVSAPVEIDGVWRGSTPLSVTVPAGDHVVRIDDGRTRVNEFLTEFTGGRSVRLEVALRPASEAWGNKGVGKPHHH